MTVDTSAGSGIPSTAPSTAAPGEPAGPARPATRYRLARAELSRLVAPPAVRRALYALPALVVLFGLSRLAGHSADTTAAWRDAEEAFQAYARTWPDRARQISPEAFFDDPRYRLVRASFADLRTLVSGLAAAALCLGVHAGGTDWGSRVMVTLTAAEPRRGRLFATRGALVAALSAAAALAAGALLVPFLLLAAHTRGITDGADARFWAVLTLMIARGALVTALVALLGYGLGMAARNTAIALGAAFAYLFLGQRLFRDYAPAATEFHLSGLQFAILNERPLMPADELPDCAGEVACLTLREGTSATTGVLGLIAYVVPVLALAWWRFTRRDIR